MERRSDKKGASKISCKIQNRGRFLEMVDAGKPFRCYAPRLSIHADLDERTRRRTTTPDAKRKITCIFMKKQKEESYSLTPKDALALEFGFDGATKAINILELHARRNEHTKSTK
jgi:hypothetical protein